MVVGKERAAFVNDGTVCAQYTELQLSVRQEAW